MNLPSGWSHDRVVVRVVVLIPYPAAQLDCFYADADLATDSMPTGSLLTYPVARWVISREPGAGRGRLLRVGVHKGVYKFLPG